MTLLSQSLLGTTCLYRRLPGRHRDLVQVEVVDAPSLRRGDRFWFLREAVDRMLVVDEQPTTETEQVA